MKDAKLTKLPESEIMIEGEIDLETIARFRKKAISELSVNLEVRGFRKGHAPEEIAAKNIGEMTVLEKIAELALAEAYPDWVKKFNLNVIDRPYIRLTKVAPENPIDFSIIVAIAPEIKLPDYRKIASGIKPEPAEEVSPDETEKAIGEIRRQFAYVRANKSMGAQNDIPESEWPELTDEFVKNLGPFDDAAAFRKKIRQHLNEEKERQAKEKNQTKLLDAIIESAEVETPKPLIEYELEKMMFHFKSDLDQAGLPLDKYLGETKRDETSLRAEWRPSAEKRAKVQLVLSKIAEKEDIKIEPKKLAEEVEHAKKHHEDANPERLRAVISLHMQNEAVINFLENLNPNKNKTSGKENQ
ncbi:MAG: hypothetical protein A2653_02575 [Candidatus Zambryskibacteria bacterium RIFCSPHIGHO2_01_FULL_43_25]|nr:MAG: hypothetical protein A2653_02575 [Candidatus Zambryskibacteria bacterium RIFCSPHIGHO2_01_FULL_43_25]OHB00350.1 MAG: hypothetical protein A3E94_00970 [Candidatus Zambryskibacteria bacterium RIFCSPHIGHO2_12_FULL_44_12b]